MHYCLWSGVCAFPWDICCHGDNVLNETQWALDKTQHGNTNAKIWIEQSLDNIQHKQQFPEDISVSWYKDRLYQISIWVSPAGGVVSFFSNQPWRLLRYNSELVFGNSNMIDLMLLMLLSCTQQCKHKLFWCYPYQTVPCCPDLYHTADGTVAQDNTTQLQYFKNFSTQSSALVVKYIAFKHKQQI